MHAYQKTQNKGHIKKLVFGVNCLSHEIQLMKQSINVTSYGVFAIFIIILFQQVIQQLLIFLGKSALQILLLIITTVSRCVYECLNVRFFRKCMLPSTKILKKITIISSRMAKVSFFYSMTMNIIFKVTLSKFFLFCEYFINGKHYFCQQAFATEWRHCACCTS